MVTSWRLARRRIAVIDASINRWGHTYASKYRTVRCQVLLGAVGAGIGAFSEMTSRRTRNSQATPVGEGEILGSQMVDDSGVIAIAGRPNAPEFGLMGAGSPQRAVSRLQAFVSYQEQPTVGALCLTAAAETITPGRDRSFIDQLDDEVVADYYEAAETDQTLVGVFTIEEQDRSIPPIDTGLSDTDLAGIVRGEHVVDPLEKLWKPFVVGVEKSNIGHTCCFDATVPGCSPALVYILTEV